MYKEYIQTTYTSQIDILQEEFLPCPVHPALFHNFGCCYIILMGHKKNQDKNEQFNIAHVLRFFCENSP
jgi:hypothetical protein